MKEELNECLMSVWPFFFKNWNTVALQGCCSFLLYKEVNQLHVSIHPLPRGPPSHPHLPYPTPLGQRGAQLNPCAAQQLPTSCLLYTERCGYVSPNLPIHPTLSSPHCPRMPSLCLHLCSCLGNRFICTIFLDTLICVNRYLFFSF